MAVCSSDWPMELWGLLKNFRPITLAVIITSERRSLIGGDSGSEQAGFLLDLTLMMHYPIHKCIG
jgi:hypothetical protein